MSLSLTHVHRLCWYAAEKTVKDLKAKEEFPLRVLNGFDALANFLVKEARIIERSSTAESVRKDSKEQVPASVKDAGALAREFRWRVRLAAGGDSGDELESPFSHPHRNGNGSGASGSVNGKRSSVTPAAALNGKTKKGGAAAGASGAAAAPRFEPRFKGFIPRSWDVVASTSVESGVSDVIDVVARPTPDDGLSWFDDRGAPKYEADGDDTVMGESLSGPSRTRAHRRRTTDEVSKMRRAFSADGTVTGLEKETVRRVYESWEFSTVVVEESEQEKMEVAVSTEEPQPVVAEELEDSLENLPANGDLQSLSSLAPDPGIDAYGMAPHPESVEEMMLDPGVNPTPLSQEVNLSSMLS